MQGVRFRGWFPALAVLGAGYACSGNPEVIVPRKIGSGGSAGDSSGGKGGSLTGGKSGGGGTLNPTGGTAGKSGTGGKGGKSGSTGGSGGTSSGGDAGDPGSGAFGGFPDIDFTYDAGLMGQGGACEQVTGKADLVKRPMDVIISIDNSASMQGEIQSVEDRIHNDFAAIIAASGIDYRVIMVSRYGNVFSSGSDGGTATDSQFSVCIGSPLSSLDCPDGATDTTLPVVHTPPRFYHHSTDIGSNNMWCRLLESYTRPDPYPVARTGWTTISPNGWSEYLRPQAFKVFIGITDDSPLATNATYTRSGQTLPRDCPNMLGDANLDGTNDQAGANAFDTALRTLGPTQFGAVGGTRNYAWYSIIGMTGPEDTPLTPTDPVETRCCRFDRNVDNTCQGTTGNRFNDAANSGSGYQYLSIMTGGLRYPSCYHDNFDGIFNAIAQGVIEGASASCEYDVPIPTNGIVDFDQTTVTYRPGGNASAGVPLTRAATDAECTTSPGFYFDSTFEKIFLCPSTCTTVQSDPAAEVGIDFGCLGS